MIGFAAGPGETRDSILRGRVHILQRRRGYRFAVDSLLLAAFARVGPGDRVLDVGTGHGTVLLALHARRRFREGVGVEVQPSLAGLARRNMALNRAEGKITVLETDVRRFYPDAPFDAVVANPPYRRISQGRLAPDSEKASARHEILLSLGELFHCGARLLRPGGRFFLVHLPERRAEMDALAAGLGLLLRREREVLSRKGEPPVLLLREYARAPAAPRKPRRERPLVLFARRGVYTREVGAILEGPPKRKRLDTFS
jgi:tRNA1Val (adenine37-N6)-methyltransferase